MRFLIISGCLIMLSCNPFADKIFWISAPDNQRNDFLFMAESTNVLPIPSDSLSYFLTDTEIFSAEKVVYKNYGEVYKNDSFKVNILFRIGAKFGRDYQFIIRTYSNDFKVIDSYELASWVESNESYCFGSLSKDLIIEKECYNELEEEIARIKSNGEIEIR